MSLLSYHLPFDNTRSLTNVKADIILDFFKSKKWLFNTINSDFQYVWPHKPSTTDIKFIKVFFSKHIQELSNFKSAFAQNLSNSIIQNFITTKKAFFSKHTQSNSNKSFFKYPKQHNFSPFSLDYRMMPQGSNSKDGFVKESSSRGWIRVSNPFHNKDIKFINLPIKLYPEVNILLDK